MDAQLNSSKVWMKYLPIFEVLAYVLNVVLMLYGGWMVITGEMTIGNLVTVNGYLWMLNAPLRMAGWWVNDTHRFITSVEKIYTTYVEEPLVKCLLCRFPANIWKEMLNLKMFSIRQMMRIS